MPPRPRLLVVSHGFPPYYGGAEHAAGYLARAAVRSGRWQVQVLTADIGGRLPPREIRDGLEILRVRTFKRTWSRHSVPELLSFLRSAQRFAPEHRPDWILANCTLPAGAVACRLARQTGAPYAVVLQGSDVPGYQNARFGLVYALAKPWIRRIWREAAQVIAVGSPLRELALRTWPGGRIEVIPNGVDTNRFRPLASNASPGKDGPLVLLAVAQLIERKGLQHLVAALAQLSPERRRRVRLSLCGTGPYEHALRRQVRSAGLDNQVEFAGLISHDRIPEILRAADVFVLPSLQEGLPLSLLEAMACGLPVVATRVGGIPEVVRDGDNGWLVPAGDARALADVLPKLLDDADGRRKIGSAARKTAQAWSWQTLWERYEALMTSVGRGESGLHQASSLPARPGS